MQPFANLGKRARWNHKEPISYKPIWRRKRQASFSDRRTTSILGGIAAATGMNLERRPFYKQGRRG